MSNVTICDRCDKRIPNYASTRTITIIVNNVTDKGRDLCLDCYEKFNSINDRFFNTTEKK